jgi:nanoRNase/pAp phosphatase (c-di-AMP/oligoRNAs hydrolase)
LVFSLYPKGIKAFAVFYENGCWLSVAKGFDGLDASELARRYGGGGHQKSAGARIGVNKLGDIKREFERVGLFPMVVDLRGEKRVLRLGENK